MTRRNFDLVVLGAGIAGISTALAAAEAGADVVLVEKTAAIGGSSAMSGGWFAFAGTDEQRELGIEDSDEAFFDDLRAVGGGRNDPELLHAYLAQQAETYRWLKTHGVEFGEVEISSGQSVRRGHSTRITEVLTRLHDAFTGLGGTTVLSQRATRLILDGTPARVVGVQTEGADRDVDLYAAQGVVIATGGFSRSAELLGVFAPEQLRAIPYGGKGNTGDGLKMAWRVGAGMADMSTVSATYGSHPDTTDDFQELLTAFYLGAVIVNEQGERFVDESMDYKALGRRVLEQSSGLGIQVFDATVRAQSHRGVPLKDIDTLEDLGHVHSAPTIAALATELGLDPDALERTVSEYNAVVAGAATDVHGRANLCNGVGDLVAIDTPPYYAYPAKPLMTTTYAGVSVSPSSEVRDVDGAEIPGLYAVGEVIGGFHGAGYMTGSSLGKGAVFGQRLGRALAQAPVPARAGAPA